ncbi:MAG: HD domain-containing protein [Nitrospirota bacterium]
MSEQPPPIQAKDIRSDEFTPKEIEEICTEISARNLGKNTEPSEHAATIEEAYRQDEDMERSTTRFPYIQNPFKEDVRRVAFSKGFERLAGKTQSCTTPTNPHITHRLTHTIRVAQIGQAIARALGANEDLVEAIAYGHDLGHPPLGHNGEIHVTTSLLETRRDILEILGAFKHNVQSLHVVDRVEGRIGFPKGTGLNLTDQVRHGILSHDGEKDTIKSIPNPDLIHKPEAIQTDIQRYLAEVINGSKGERDPKKVFAAASKARIQPATLEGAIVAMVDVLHYAPEDFEDQVGLGVIRREELPADIARELGKDGATMTNRLVNDLLIHSYGKNEITYSEKIGTLVNKFKRDFLYNNYPKVNSLAAVESKDPRVRISTPNLQERMTYLFKHFLEVLKDSSGHKKSSILDFREGRDEVVYGQKMEAVYGKFSDEEAYYIAMVMDYIAGFTDDYFFTESEAKYK